MRLETYFNSCKHLSIDRKGCIWFGERPRIEPKFERLRNMSTTRAAVKVSQTQKVKMNNKCIN